MILQILIYLPKINDEISSGAGHLNMVPLMSNNFSFGYNVLPSVRSRESFLARRIFGAPSVRWSYSETRRFAGRWESTVGKE